MPPHAVSEEDIMMELKGCLVDYNNNKQVGGLKKGSITWEANDTIHDVPCLGDLDDAEVSACWYNGSDYGLIKAQIKVIAARMAQRQQEDGGEYCYRGLEYKTKIIGNRRKMRKARAMNSVLEEQKRQRSTGNYDDEILSEVYKGYTSMCLQEALRMGLRDSEIATAIIRDTNDILKESATKTLASDDSNDSVFDASDMDSVCETIDSERRNKKMVAMAARATDGDKSRRRSSV